MHSIIDVGPNLPVDNIASKSKDPIHEAFLARLSSPELGYSPNHIEVLKSKSVQLLEHARFNAGLSSMKLNDEETVRLLKSIDDLIVSIGNPIDTTPKDATKAAQFLQAMLMGEIPSLWDMLKNFDLFLSILFKRNPQFDADSKAMLQWQLDAVYKYMSESSVAGHLGVEAFLMNVLSLYPFFNPQEGDLLFVPQVIEGKVERVPCIVNKIQLTPDWMGSPIYALGLSPQNNPKASPYVIFKGTTYPSDDGALLSILADISPFASVGKWVMVSGQDPLKKWLGKHSNKALTCGMSLGGALAQHLAVNFPTLIKEVYAFVPPSLWLHEVASINALPEDQIPKVKKFYNDQDIVCLDGIGEIKGSKTYKLYDMTGRGALLAHMRIFAAVKDHLIVKVDNNQDQCSTLRKVLTVVHAILAVPLFLITMVLWAVVQLIRLLIQGVQWLIENYRTDK